MSFSQRKGSRSTSISTMSSTSLTLTRTISAPTLENLNLSHILNGETCPPISFSDFAAFITHKEFSTENLLFIIWFRSYRARYEALSDSVKLGIPIPSTKLGDRYYPFKHVDEAMSNRVHVDEEVVDSERIRAERGEVVFDIPFSSPGKKEISPKKPSPKKEPKRVKVPAQHDFKKCEWCQEHDKSCQCEKHRPGPRVSEPILNRGSSAAMLPPFGVEFTDPSEQAMRQEAERAFSTFLRKGGSRELGVSDDLRQFTKTCLKRSTAPEVFLPLYEEIYHVVESQSLPHFLSYAKTNINRPKQVFWYTVGISDMLIGLLIYLSLTFALGNRSFAYRATRLPAAIFLCFGSMQAYSAYRGFCTQVWGRSSRQIRPWEMDEVVDEEAAVRSAGVDISRVNKVADSINSEGPFTPTEHKDGYDLPDEVHPLTDLSSIIPAPKTALAPWETAALPSFQSDIDLGLSDKAMKQLQIRRATIAVPDANLVFPINEESKDVPVSDIAYPTSPFINSISLSPNKATFEISPFEMNDIPTSGPSSPTPSSTTSPRKPSSQPTISQPSTTQTQQPSPTQPTSQTQQTVPDLSSLMMRFRRSEPKDPERFAATTKTREKKLTSFGPEKLIEDPRIKQMHDKVVKDILVLGGIVFAVWVVLCLAVPLYGN